MVGFDPDRREKGLTSLQCGFCGSLSGMVTRLLIQPLDVLKIRFQLQVEPITKVAQAEAKYSGIYQATRLIVKEEGVISLWKGHVPAQILSVLYGYVTFMTFEATTKLACVMSPELTNPRWKPVTHFVCGGISGCAAVCSAQPLDTIRTRLVAQGEPKVYNTFLDATRRMYLDEGVTSYYRGLLPTLLQIFPYAGMQFGFYAMFKLTWDRLFQLKRLDPYAPVSINESLVCGGLSGICSKTAIYPLDMVKKRLQVQGFEEARQRFGKTQQYNGMLDCFKVIWIQEGMAGFLKGMSPSILKAGVSVAITFCVYEQCLSFVRKYLHKETDQDTQVDSYFLDKS